MDKMKFMMFSWKQNPEHFGISAYCLPEYEPNSSGGYDFTGIGQMSRVITGKGVFCGEDAVGQFNALSVIMAARREGELVHPVLGTTKAYLTDLVMEQESRPDYIVYSFTFRETDELGGIPRVPDIDNRE